MTTILSSVCGQKEDEPFSRPIQEGDTVCELFLAHGRLQDLKVKEVLFHKGDSPNDVYVIFKGRVHVSAPSVNGKEIIFFILGPGHLVGEAEVITGNPRAATVTALELTTVISLKKTVFFSLMVQHPEIVFYLSRTLATRLEYTTNLLEDFVFLNIGPRLAKRLLALAATFGQKTAAGLATGLPICQQDLGAMVGASRESVNKQLRLWESKGILSLQQGFLVLENQNFLKRLCNDS